MTDEDQTDRELRTALEFLAAAVIENGGTIHVSAESMGRSRQRFREGFMRLKFSDDGLTASLLP